MGEHTLAAIELSEIELAKKNPAAFEPLYKRHFEVIYNYVRKSVGNKDLAADLTSEVFYAALCNLNKFKSTEHGIRPWLFKIALNQIRMHFRKHKKAMLIPMDEIQLVSLVSDENKLEANDLRRILSAHLSELSEVDQELIQLRFTAGFSFKEIGHILNINEDAAKMRMSRLVDKLKRSLPKWMKP
jgi:RNA polymerase sigma-70 factor (ECF subfamily)